MKIPTHFTNFENQYILVTTEAQPKPLTYHPSTNTYSILDDISQLQVHDCQYSQNKTFWFSSASEPDIDYQFAVIKVLENEIKIQIKKSTEEPKMAVNGRSKTHKAN